MSGTILVEPRFNGPPDSGNGGYVCGLVAVATGAGVKVRLHRPPPLEVPLLVEELEEGRWQVRDQADVVASATATTIDLDPPEPPSYLEALELSKHYTGFVTHAFPTCFVCGPDRAPGDGLRIFAGRLPAGEGVAAGWLPHDSLADEAGKVRAEFIWAALDCPGYFAAVPQGRTALLGELAVHIDRRIRAGDPCVVMGWPLSSSGRKHQVATALFDEDGVSIARGIATWIEIAGP